MANDMDNTAPDRFRPVCKVTDVPQGAARMYFVDDRRIGIYHLEDGFYALDDQCPHAGASLALGFILDDVVACRIHHWHFCIRSGKYLDAEDTRCDLRRYAVRVVNGEVSVAI
jgi:nitrite reductase (NADH) small subunit